MQQVSDWVAVGGDVSIRHGAATTVGKIRNVNEDSFLVSDTVYAVADGMGGHRSGDVASRLTLDVVTQTLAGRVPRVEELSDVVDKANLRVRLEAVEQSRLGMGTTLVAVVAVQNSDAVSLAVLNVGDSRCYEMVGGELRQVSTDHSLVQEMVDRGEITPDEVRTHPDRNVVTRAIGVDPMVSGDYFILPDLGVSRLLLCSDGVHGELSDEAIASVLRHFDEPQRTADALIELVMEHPARDNATVVVVDVRRAARLDDVRTADITGPRPPRIGSTAPLPGSIMIDAVPGMGERAASDQGATVTPLIDEVPR